MLARRPFGQHDEARDEREALVSAELIFREVSHEVWALNRAPPHYYSCSRLCPYVCYH